MRLNVFKARISLRKRCAILLIGTLFCLATILAKVYGLFIYPFELNFYNDFSYPLDIDLRSTVDSIITQKYIQPMPKVINGYNYQFIIPNEDKCSLCCDKGELTLLIVVKSALHHFDRRNAIRKSWGSETRFPNYKIKRIFILGNCVDRYGVKECGKAILDESKRYKDIVEADFLDTYYNNTIKTMMAFKWIYKHCLKARFILFADDDYYISTKNLLNSLVISEDYPLIDYNMGGINEMRYKFNKHLYMGYVFPYVKPKKILNSKWFVTLHEYSYSHYPPYVTAGAYVLSNYTLLDMYFGSHYTKHFRFDGVYLGLIALKLGLKPLHNRKFHFLKLDYDFETYSQVIASHGYSDPKEMLYVWNQQNSLENASQ